MGWCHEFGARINDSCEHPMTAGSESCGCEACGVICKGRFASCEAVWARGPQLVQITHSPSDAYERAVTQTPLGDPPMTTPSRPPAPGEWAPVEPIAGVPSDLRGPGGDARLEVMEWLRSAFDGMRAELRVLSDGVARQQTSIADMVEANQAMGELASIAEVLPARVAAAVAEAVASISTAPSPEAQETLDGVRDALIQLETMAEELRSESLRLHAFREALAADLPSVARAVDEAAARADARLAELSDRIDDLASRKGLSGLVRSFGARPADG
jgi:hypothetical protein